MNKLREAARMALEALVKCDSALAEELAAWDIDPPLHHVLEASKACAPAITDLREALATAAQPPKPLCAVSLMKVVLAADERMTSKCVRGTTNWAAAIGIAVQDAVIAAAALKAGEKK